jgi:LssY C-terminus
MGFWKFPLLAVPYDPRPQERSFLERTEVRQQDDVVVEAAVLDATESDAFFGVPLARRGIQPVWLRISNNGHTPCRLRLASLDPNYFPPLEAAFVNHFRIGRRLLAFGFLALLYLPLLILLPFKVLGARSANRRMDAYFQEHGIGWGLIGPGHKLEGFVFTGLDEGTKQFSVRLTGSAGVKDFGFAILIPGMKVDHGNKQLTERAATMQTVDCDEAELRRQLEAMPRCTTNKKGTVEGDPLNLVAIGSFATILNGFGARWDETETISLESCWRTLKAFSLGSRYRYSPVSSLYMAGRCQDFALQRARQTINERLHLRLWMTPLRFRGEPVWIGQISRDIGVRFTHKTWNLTTHKIDPNVDDSRDYLLDDLTESGRVSLVGYSAGVGSASRTSPRRNLTGDTYYTDGLRAVVMFSKTRTTSAFLQWA